MKKRIKRKLAKKNISGMSLVEILITISVFAILGILTTRAVITTLKGARKSDSQTTVKENINYAFSIMERQIRSAENISPCPNPDTTTISYTSLEGELSTFSCNLTADTGYIASGSARLTSTDVVVTSCSISCVQEKSNYPPTVSISISAIGANSSGSEAGAVTMKTEIVGRNY